ncbi:MAG: ribose-phosphate pyrophosphokinase [Chloroflexia bacterium]|nr:ribose-phosphate pyrophosphokinase [Chloroflexia bacterium]
MRDITVFSGGAHPGLADSVCDILGVGRSPATISRFSNDCLGAQLDASCRESDVFLIQPLVPPVQEHLIELLLMLDAARGASAARTTAVIPYYAYARSDKQDAPRISIAGRLVADLLAKAGANRLLTVSLHAPQVLGFFSVPVDHLNALHVLAAHFRGRDLSSTVVVSPDLGNVKSASQFARLLDLPVAAGRKQRISDERVVIDTIMGDVAGREILLLDDEISSGVTIVEMLGVLRKHGAGQVTVVCTHGLFTKDALRRIAVAPGVVEIVTTDTVPPPPDAQLHNVRVLSMAPLLANAIQNIHNGESVSSL